MRHLILMGDNRTMSKDNDQEYYRVPRPKVHVGYRVYASNDGMHVILEADDESGSPARIYLEANVLAAVLDYAKQKGMIEDN